MVVVVYLLEQTNKHVKVWKVPYVNERMWMDEHGLDWLVCLAVQRLQSVLVHELRFPLYVMAMQLFESCDIHSKRNLRIWLCRFPSTFLSSPLHPSLDFQFLSHFICPKRNLFFRFVLLWLLASSSSSLVVMTCREN